MEKFTVITCTGDRPEAFNLCQYYVQRQTVQPTQWIIVDDGKMLIDPLDLQWVSYVRRALKSTDPKHTLPVQLLEALRHVKYEKIIIMEDDDWYAPTYCEDSLYLLDIADLVGHADAVYYNLPKRQYSVRGNRAWSCLNETCFTVNAVPLLIDLIKEDLDCFCVDLAAWRRLKVKKQVFVDKKKLCVGMKGLSGRFGMGMGHGATPGFKDDRDCAFLKSVIDGDVVLYGKWLDAEKVPGNVAHDIAGLRK